VAMIKNYCKAGFPCQFKRLRRTKQKGNQKHWYFVVCKFEGTCNQQTCMVVKEKLREE